VRDVHSSYFEMLGEQGFIGFGLYLTLLLYCLMATTRLKWVIRSNPDLRWAQHYPDMLQVAILAYMLGGAFLGRAYFDLFYHIVAAIIILGQLVKQPQAAEAQQPVAAPVELPVYAHPATRVFQTSRN
jgi:putative inorganic carbon (hco3(-)) transporter